MRSHTPSIELLEPRIAPATVTVAYTDLDGDRVRISATLPYSLVAPLDLADLAFTDGNPDGQLAALTLTEAGFADARIVFDVTRRPGGDGLAHVGFINATGLDLDRVVVKGDLGRIVVGDEVTHAPGRKFRPDPGLHLLQVRSMGTLGLFTQGGQGDLHSIINGELTALVVARDFTDAYLEVTSPPDNAETPPGLYGDLGSVFIGGDLTGGVADYSGRIASSARMGDVTIAGDIAGGAGEYSGSLEAGSVGVAVSVGRVSIYGSVTGGAGQSSGAITGHGNQDSVRISGSVTGGAGVGSGSIANFGMAGLDGRPDVGGIRGVRIGGNLVGGTEFFSGVIYSDMNIGAVSIVGDVVGGSAAGAGYLSDSGMIRSKMQIRGVTIGGSLIGGSDSSSATLERCGAIIAGEDLGYVHIHGGVIGNAANPARISAVGKAVKPTTGSDLAIGNITIGGDVRFANILGGFAFTSDPYNADASIGAVRVAGDWVASNLVAGAQDAGTPGFGTGDTLQTMGNTALIASIASIQISGGVTGSVTTGDHFGFVAQQIGSFRFGTRVYALGRGPSNDSFAIPFTSDVSVVEV